MGRVRIHTVPKIGTAVAPTDFVTTYFEYNPSGTVKKVTDGNSHITTFDYNEFDLKKKMTYPQLDTQSVPDYQEWGYDANKNLVSRRTVSGALQTFAYDSRNRKTAMRWSNSVDFADFGYDDAGRLTFAQNPYSTIVRGYDDAGRMLFDKQTMPAVAPTPAPLIDRPAVVSRKTHDLAGDFDIPLPLTGSPGIETRGLDARSGGPAGPYKMVATFAHAVTLINASVSSGIGTISATGVTTTQSGGTEITIDLADVSTAQLIVVMLSVRDGDVSDTIAIPMQVLVGETTGNGVVNSNDASAIVPHIGEPVTASNFRFDVKANGIIDIADKQLAAANTGTGVASVPPGTLTEVDYGYDNDGRVTHISIPSAYDYSQGYDTLGRLLTIGPGTTVEHEYQYDKASNVIHRINHVNGTGIDYVPDALNRIHDLKINVPNQPIPVGGASRNWFTHEVYGYDPMNRLTMIQRDEEPAMSDQFGYYLNGELNSADYGLHWVTDHWENPAHAVDYNLDKAGNRTGAAGVTADGTAYPYAPNALNQYTNANGGTVGNGLNHEIASYDGKTYSYLNDTHLAQVSYSDVSGVHLYSLGYDALGRCVNRTTGISSSSYYIYDGDKPIYEFDSAGGTPSINVYGRGIDEILYRSNHGSGQYFEQDHEGSVLAVTGGDGSLLEWYRYDAFGAPTMYKPDGSVNTTGASLINNRFLFTGREYAPQYGFYEYRARAYHPGIGRFMAEDPTLYVRGLALGKSTDKWSFEAHPDESELNLFRYCNNDPWDLIDPMGLDFLWNDSAGAYFHEVGQAFLGEAKGIASVASFGIYQPTSSNINQQGGVYVGQAAAIAASLLAPHATVPEAPKLSVKPLEGTEAGRAALGRGPNAQAGASLTGEMVNSLKGQLSQFEQTQNLAKQGLNRAGNPIGAEQQQRVINTTQRRIDEIKKALSQDQQLSAPPKQTK